MPGPEAFDGGAAPRFRVVLDPGHGGHEKLGASTPNRARGPLGSEEKHIVLDIAKRAAAALRDHRTEVWLTREIDENRSLAQRIGAARRRQADVFVSLHLGDGTLGHQGTCTFVHSEAGPNSRSLAEALHAGVRSSLELTDLGLRVAPMAVLDPRWHRAQTSTCLIELCVLADAAQEDRMNQAAYRQHMALELGSALRRWLVDWRSRRAQLMPVAGGGRRQALIVGIDQYFDVEQRLRFATADARSVRETVLAGFGFEEGDVEMLLDAEAMRDALLTRLQRRLAKAKPGEAAMFYFAGRGAVRAGQPVLVAADGGVISRTDLQSIAEKSPVGVLVVITDSGHAHAPGVVDGGRSWKGMDLLAASEAQEPNQHTVLESKVAWLSAAAPGVEALEHAELGHGLMTQCLLDRVTGGFDITLGMLRQRLADDMQTRVLRLGAVLNPQPWLSASDRSLRFPSTHTDSRPDRVSVQHYVPLVSQRTGMSCWAAGAAMLIGWRDQISVNGEEVARGAGRWAEFRQGLAPRDISSLAQMWGLQTETADTWTVHELAELLERYGPLWIGEADPELHVVVLTGIEGDGTPDGTHVSIADPWPVERGERYVVPFRELITNFEVANELVGLHAQVLHTGGRDKEAPKEE